MIPLEWKSLSQTENLPHGFPDFLCMVIRRQNEQSEMQDALTEESFLFPRFMNPLAAATVACHEILFVS